MRVFIFSEKGHFLEAAPSGVLRHRRVLGRFSFGPMWRGLKLGVDEAEQLRTRYFRAKELALQNPGLDQTDVGCVPVQVPEPLGATLMGGIILIHLEKCPAGTGRTLASKEVRCICVM